MAVMCRGVEVISKTQILAWGAGINMQGMF